MAFDGFTTRALANELAEQLIGGRIHKIYQPHETDLIFHIRSHGKTYSLLLSANPTFPRLYVTTKTMANPTEPPMFCMLLRKHLEGGVITDVVQVSNERIIHMDIHSVNELGDIQNKRLILEIMGRHSNIILINPENNVIIDGINHVTPAISAYRTVLPGREYIAPPEQNKVNPLEETEESFMRRIQLNEGNVDKQLVAHYIGMSPNTAQEIVYLAGLPTRENLWSAFKEWIGKAKEHQYQPTISEGIDKTDFSIQPITHLKEATHQSFNSIGLCLEQFYDEKAKRDTIRQKVQDLSRLLINEKVRSEKKIEFLLKDKKKAEDAEKLRLYGELITGHLHLIKRGDKEAKVTNYYDENQGEITIPLDPLKTPSENAQAFFKKYNKLKTSFAHIDEQLEATKSDINYLDTIITQLENANVEDLEDIREELMDQGYLKNKNRSRKKKKDPKIEKYRSSEGITIYVGKNNRQNEFLTHKLANASDTWLHTKDIPGSHVVIKGTEFGEKTIEEAAKLAAYYSKAKLSNQVPVDYTLIKHVKKPSGAKPGFVIYTHQNTVYVKPEEQLVDLLREK